MKKEESISPINTLMTSLTMTVFDKLIKKSNKRKSYYKKEAMKITEKYNILYLFYIFSNEIYFLKD